MGRGVIKTYYVPATSQGFFDSELLRIMHVPNTMPSTGETEVRESVPTLTESMVHWGDTYKRQRSL